MVSKIGGSMSENELKKMLNELDEDKNGEIEFGEFISYMKNK